MNISEETKSTFSVREMLMFRALEIAGKMLRKNPMGDLDLYPIELYRILACGSNRDPEGEEYVSYFLNAAAKELKEEGRI